jgi:hypothetical protein
MVRMFSTPQCWDVRVEEFVAVIETDLQGCSIFCMT